jgi:hypothetical protein
MKPKFEVIFLDEVWEFFDLLDSKTKEKIIYNIDKSRFINDPQLFKKLDDEIWEFRTRFNRLNYRISAFWDKTKETETLVIATHGIIKKRDKVPGSEIEKAKAMMMLYFKQKKK